MKTMSNARLSNGWLIFPKGIQLITGCDLGAAIREHKYIRKYLGTGSEDLLVSQYCKFNNLDYREIRSFLSTGISSL